MARKKRVWYPGAMYHIMCRGNHKHDIFREEADKQIYLQIVLQSKTKHDFVLFSYCLMSNHVHLQLKTKDTEISTIMKQINMNYAIYFNNKYGEVGHLFQGRFRSELIDSDTYILELSKYIHLNPVRAELVKRPQEYAWSSYHNYLGNKHDDLVFTDFILDYFKVNAPTMYQVYVESALGASGV